MLDNRNWPCNPPSTCYSSKRVRGNNRCLIYKSTYIVRFDTFRWEHTVYPPNISTCRFHQHSSFGLDSSDLRYKYLELGHIQHLRFRWKMEDRYISFCVWRFDIGRWVHKGFDLHKVPYIDHWYRPRWIYNWCQPNNELEWKMKEIWLGSPWRIFVLKHKSIVSVYL